MAYQVLARKWRPQTFSELVGQQHVVDAITNALDNDKLHHAYLFTGTRGVGKTTIARIFSKSLNCEQGQSANPCGQCATCVDISEGRYVDLLEIDAASRTKVEDTRDILDNVQYKPTRGKYKVYLIDEVHMLSKHSFNALLKTLEEPPEHVKFLLATTDPQKLPVTILSRCLQFNLKALSQEQIQAHLSYIFKNENIRFEDSALSQLAKAAQGSIRDSLSLSDQAIAQGNNQVSFDVVSNMLGLLNKNQILKLLKLICERDSQGAIAQLDNICSQTSDYQQALSQLAATLHQVALTQIVPEVCKLEGDSAKGIYTLASTLSKEHLQIMYQICINGSKDLPFAPDMRSGLQMTVLRMLAYSPAQKIDIDVDALIADEQANKAMPAFDTISDNALTKTKVAQTLESNTVVPEPPILSEAPPPSPNSNESPELIELITPESQNLQTVASEHEELPIADSVMPEVAVQQEDANTGYGTDMFGEPLPMQESESSFDEYNPQNTQHTAVFDQNQGQNVPPNTDTGSTDDASIEDNKSEIERTRQLLEASRLIDEYTEKKEENSGVKKPETEAKTVAKAVDVSGFALGHQFKKHQGDYNAFLPNGDKLVLASQVDEWSAFIDSTRLQALSRQLLLHANCEELSTKLQINIKEQYKNLCEDEIVKNVEDILSMYFGEKLSLKIEFTDTKNTPFQIQTRINDMRLEYARNIVHTDSKIKELTQIFDAILIEDSIEYR